MPLKLNSSGGGSVTLDVPVTASAFNVIVPANAGTVVTTGSTAAVTQGMLAAGVAGNGPAFGAYLGSNQPLSTNVFTKLNINVEEFDTNNCYNTSLYRFTPNVAGYYFVTGTMTCVGTVYVVAYIYKNGVLLKEGVQGAATNAPYRSNVSALIYMNGTTDFLELYGLQGGATPFDALAGVSPTFFSAFLARTA